VSEINRNLPQPADTLEVTPQRVAQWVNSPLSERPRLIDCREEDELAICQISGNEWIPLRLFSGLRDLLQERNERGVVVYCHHGMRSLRAVQYLRAIGVENAFSMSGGIEEWSTLIDPEIPRY
jgi:rhodanese-related sulfurtransferase